MRKTAIGAVVIVSVALFLRGGVLAAQDGGGFVLGPYALSINGESRGVYESGYLPDSGVESVSVYEFTQTFSLPESLTGERLSLLVGPHSYPFEILINGRLVYSRGDPAGNIINPVSYDPSTAPLDRAGLFRPGGDEILIRAWATAQRNPLFSAEILPYRAAETAFFWRKFANTGITQASFIVGVVIFIYFLFLFLLLKGRDKHHLWFSLFSLLYSICYSNMAFNFPANSFLLLEKISRTGFLIEVMVLVFFFTDYLGIMKKSRIGTAVKAVDALVVVVFSAILWTRKTNIQTDAVFSPLMTFYIFPNLLFCLGLIIAALVKEKFKRHKVTFLAFSSIFATAAHDISYVTKGVNPYAFLLSLGFLSFILAVFFILAAEQARLESEARSQSATIEQRGKAMAVIMDKLRAASGSIVSCSDHLKEISAASIQGVNSYEEDSRAIQELVSSRLGGIERSVSELNESLGKSGTVLREAIDNQARLVDGIARSVEAMNARVESIRTRTASSGGLATHLAGIARESSAVIDRARESIDRIRESSGFIRSVLDSVNDISEQTSILSINAAIEAARAGEAGKGFTIVASSIRSLAGKTKDTVDSSLVQLSGMNELLEETGNLSHDVAEVLETIVRESDETAVKVNEASAEVDSQEGEFAEIMESTRRMALDQQTIKELSDRNEEDKRDHMAVLEAIKGEFDNIAAKMRRQHDEGEKLRARIDELESVVKESGDTVALLQSILQEG